ncbi:2-hydroxy-3-oxopropionate reductase [Spinactinospora alkalitolerans]|uniref:2-hydroxy-3-oxopropionate reductase n=1 Tax=Spinactinospora alkalitolerans TaxID=687207 RepID=A0A852U3F2_9ACTN|nr:2-hydroxy-3-oxopropionate reductase [Spinactinospora alkalitolerans]NYE48480.1 2-hydroxy-3-oxopropionate reductase [Spinactinospora alkalitolerans]
MTAVEYRPGETKIGFVGLGLMGEPMARNLVSAGFDVTVHNRSREAVDRLATAGAKPAGSPAAAAAEADVVIVMLPDAPDVRTVVLSEDGIASTLREGGLLIDMSTISAGVTRELADTLAEQGVRMLDAPVSGGQQGAVDAALSIMVGGEESVFERARPIFAALGTRVTLIGGNGSGQVAKACNQVIVAGTIQAVAEALALARHSGVAPDRVREALLGGLAGSKILEVHGRRMLDGAFEPGFKTRLHDKDLGIALEAASEAGVPLPTTALVRQFFNALIASGDGDADHAALALVVERLAGAGGGRRTP